MKFRKLALIGPVSGMLDDGHRRRIEDLTEVIVTLSRDDHRISTEILDADGVIVAFGVPVDRAMIDAAPKLRYLGVASTAYDMVDVAYARDKGITVTTLPDYNTEPVAQFVLAVMLEQASGLAEGRRNRQAGNLSPLAFPARQLKDGNVAVVGLGTIGSRVAELACGFGANVAYWSRRRKDKSGYAYRDLDVLLAEADFISVNLALTAETEGIFNAAHIEAIKPGAVVVSAAPMALFDLGALGDRMAEGDIRVVLNHALPNDIARFRDHPNFVFPPLVYLSPQAHNAMQDLLLANLQSFLASSL